MVLLLKEKAEKACLGKPLQDSEREERRFCDKRCRVDVEEKATEQYQGSFSSDSENSVLTNKISENTWNEELNKRFCVKIQLREDYH